MASKPTVVFAFSTSGVRVLKAETGVPVGVVSLPTCIKQALAGGWHAAVEQRLLEELSISFRDIFTRMLLTRASDVKLLVVSPSCWPTHVTNSITTALLTVVRVHSLLWLHSPEAAVVGCGRWAGVSVDGDEGTCTPVVDGSARPSSSVCTFVRSGHLYAAAVLVLVAALRSACGHSVPVRDGRGSDLPGHAVLLPGRSTVGLGRACPSYRHRGWQPSLDDSVVFPGSSGQKGPAWAAQLAGGRCLPTEEPGVVGDVCRWAMHVMTKQHPPPGAGDTVVLPVPYGLAKSVGMKPTGPPDPAAPKGTAASLPRYDVSIPAQLWAAVDGLLFDPQACAAAVLESCGGPVGRDDDLLLTIHGAAATCMTDLRDSQALSLQEAVCTCLSRTELPLRRPLVEAIVPHGSLWRPDMSALLAREVREYITNAAGSDARIRSLLPLLPHVRVSRVASPEVRGASALGSAMAGTVRMVGGNSAANRAGTGKNKAVHRGGAATLTSMPPGQRYSTLSAGVGPATALTRSDALVEASLTPAQARAYGFGDGQDNGKAAGQGTWHPVLPVYDWSATVYDVPLQSPPGSEPPQGRRSTGGMGRASIGSSSRRSSMGSTGSIGSAGSVGATPGRRPSLGGAAASTGIAAAVGRPASVAPPVLPPGLPKAGPTPGAPAAEGTAAASNAARLQALSARLAAAKKK